MLFRRLHFAFSSVAICGAVALAFSASAAKADVFEMGSNGEWKQLNKQPYDRTEFGISPAGADGEKLPPVKLVAITAAPQAVDLVSGAAINPSPARGQYAPVINAAAQQYGISPALVDAVMWQESRYNPRAISSAGAIGLMQLMPGTARSLGVNPHDPWQNVFGGAAYLRTQLDRFGNNVPLALAAYNAGPEAVAKHGGVPPYAETRNYVSTIMRRLGQ
jgi:soluble lytic murein transglycosylase-like protein